MKKSSITKIAALRKVLTHSVHTSDSLEAHVKEHLGETLKYEIEDVVNNRGHAAKQITIYDKNDAYRQIQAEICVSPEEFTFKGIGLAESIRHSNAQLVCGMGRHNQINSKQAWIVDYRHENGGFYKVLVSYFTVIAVWKTDTNVIYLQPHARNYSNTTRRHLSDFEKHCNSALALTNKTAVLKWATIE